MKNFNIKEDDNFRSLGFCFYKHSIFDDSINYLKEHGYTNQVKLITDVMLSRTISMRDYTHRKYNAILAGMDNGCDVKTAESYEELDTLVEELGGLRMDISQYREEHVQWKHPTKND